MKNILKRFALFFKPTEKFKEALKNIMPGDILYLSQGAIPNKEVAGYQIVTKVENGQTFVTWGGTSLSVLKRLRDKVIDGTYVPKLIYWEPLTFNLETGYVKEHGDLQVTSILKDESPIRIYPSMKVYYVCHYGIVTLATLAIFALCVWIASFF